MTPTEASGRRSRAREVAIEILPDARNGSVESTALRTADGTSGGTAAPSGRIAFTLGWSELTFRLHASGLRSNEAYALVFFPEAGGHAVPMVLGSAITSRRGNLALRGAASASVASLGGTTPTEFFYAFAPWLVPDSDLDVEPPVERFTAWNPDAYLDCAGGDE